MLETTTYHCDNCGMKISQENAKFETSIETFQAGFEFESPVQEYKTVLCSKCYNNYQLKRDRSSYGEPDIDIPN